MSKTLTSSGWTGDTAPYTQTISVGTEYTDPTIFEITSDPSNTDEQNQSFLALSGSPSCTLSNGTLTIKIYGEKPDIDIPILIIVRGEI